MARDNEQANIKQAKQDEETRQRLEQLYKEQSERKKLAESARKRRNSIDYQYQLFLSGGHNRCYVCNHIEYFQSGCLNPICRRTTTNDIEPLLNYIRQVIESSIQVDHNDKHI